jgi:hypothetical protein
VLRSFVYRIPGHPSCPPPHARGHGQAAACGYRSAHPAASMMRLELLQVFRSSSGTATNALPRLFGRVAKRAFPRTWQFGHSVGCQGKHQHRGDPRYALAMLAYAPHHAALSRAQSPLPRRTASACRMACSDCAAATARTVAVSTWSWAVANSACVSVSLPVSP